MNEGFSLSKQVYFLKGDYYQTNSPNIQFRQVMQTHRFLLVMLLENATNNVYALKLATLSQELQTKTKPNYKLAPLLILAKRIISSFSAIIICSNSSTSFFKQQHCDDVKQFIIQSSILKVFITNHLKIYLHLGTLKFIAKLHF